MLQVRTGALRWRFIASDAPRGARMCAARAWPRTSAVVEKHGLARYSLIIEEWGDPELRHCCRVKAGMSRARPVSRWEMSF
jgi:hypothetical protein